jgi:hypothetical protein
VGRSRFGGRRSSRLCPSRSSSDEMPNARTSISAGPHQARSTMLSEVQGAATLALTIFGQRPLRNAWRTFDVVSAHHPTHDDFSAHFRCGFGAPLNKWALWFRRTRRTKKVRRNDIKSALTRPRKLPFCDVVLMWFRCGFGALTMWFRRTFFSRLCRLCLPCALRINESKGAASAAKYGGGTGSKSRGAASQRRTGKVFTNPVGPAAAILV